MNLLPGVEKTSQARSRVRWVAALASLLSIAVVNSQAQTNQCASGRCCRALDEGSPWSLEAGSGVLIGNVRDSHLDSYTIVPATLTLSYQLSHVYLADFWGGRLSGRVEPLVDGYYSRILNSGSETFLAGFQMGARYNITSLGNHWVPFCGATVGAAHADSHQYFSNGEHHGLGQDFNFNFTVDAGIRYDFGGRYFVRLYGTFTHYSNGGLSEPAHPNKALDNVGPVLSLGMHF